MRHIGTVDDQLAARRVTSYFITEGIDAIAEEDPDGRWSVWVRNENHVARGVAEFAGFLADPSNSKYDNREQAASSIRREEVKKRERSHRHTVDARTQWGRGKKKKQPLTMTLLAISVAVFLLTGFGENRDGLLMTWMMFLEPPFYVDMSLLTKFDSILHFQVWRLVTPIFLHFDFAHIAFNMIWLFIFGGDIENRKGWLQFGIMVLVMAVVSNVLQAVFVNPSFGGMSGVDFGLISYVWMKTRFDRNETYSFSPVIGIFAVLYLVVGFADMLLLHGEILGGIAHWAHLGGFLSGVGLALIPVYLRDGKIS